ncbi:phage tail sheath protein [Escherichia coli]|nr:phage tail sheath protein [Escherichia coli]SQZ10260.1 phage tail sheath protein [Escherichia coli]
MSTKLTGYVWDGCAASGMKLSSVAIMARLADFSNDEGVCWPSIETIARQIGAGMSTVRTAIGRLEAEGWLTEMNDTSGRWSYARQLYGHVYTAKTGTLSELVNAGDQFNQQHITLAGYEKETQTPADELAASRTARAAVFIRNDPARPTQTGELVGMLPAPKGKRFTMTEQQTLLSHGVATAYVESGVLRIQRDVTTYRKNAYGVADNSYLDSETLHTSAYVLRKLKSVITSKYGRHKLASDGSSYR